MFVIFTVLLVTLLHCLVLLVGFKPFNDQCSHYIDTSQLICSANQLTGFYMMGTLVVKGLINYFFVNTSDSLIICQVEIELLNKSIS